MAIAINSKELMTLLEVTPSWQNIMLTGRHGIGKSQILTKYFESKGIEVKTLFLGQMSDPGDLLGLPAKDEATGNGTQGEPRPALQHRLSQTRNRKVRNNGIIQQTKYPRVLG